MAQSGNNIARSYDLVAGEYADRFLGEHETKPMDKEMLLRFSRMVGGSAPVWDFGCGPGHTAQYLKNTGVSISGLDLSEGMLEEARRRYPDIPFQRGDLLNLEFENDSIATVVSFYAIVHFTKLQARQAFQEVFRVLRPGGVFLLTFHIGSEIIHVDEFLGRKMDIDFMFFPTNFVVGSLSDCGFSTVEVIEREPYPAVEYQSRRAYVFSMKPDCS